MGLGGNISGVWARSGINKRATSLRVSPGALEMRCVRCSYRRGWNGEKPIVGGQGYKFS